MKTIVKRFGLIGVSLSELVTWLALTAMLAGCASLANGNPSSSSRDLNNPSNQESTMPWEASE